MLLLRRISCVSHVRRFPSFKLKISLLSILHIGCITSFTAPCIEKLIKCIEIKRIYSITSYLSEKILFRENRSFENCLGTFERSEISMFFITIGYIVFPSLVYHNMQEYSLHRLLLLHCNIPIYMIAKMIV